MTQAQIEDFGDEKNAKLTLKLRAKSGYQSEISGAVSVNQWHDINCILNGEPTRTERALIARVAQATAGDEVPSLLRPPLTVQGAKS